MSIKILAPSWPCASVSAIAYVKEILSIYCRVATLKIIISALSISLLPLRNRVEAQPQLSVFRMTSLVAGISFSLENNFQPSQFKRLIIFFIQCTIVVGPMHMCNKKQSLSLIYHRGETDLHNVSQWVSHSVSSRT